MKTEQEIKEELKTWELRQKGYNIQNSNPLPSMVYFRIETLRWVLEWK